MKFNTLTHGFGCVLLLTITPPALAHDGNAALHGFIQAFSHPLQELDHILVIMSVGLWSRAQVGKIIGLLPLAFLIFMSLGALNGGSAQSQLIAEMGIVLSVLLSGHLLTTKQKITTDKAIAVVALIRLCHGQSHAFMIVNDSATTLLCSLAGLIMATSSLLVIGSLAGLFKSKLSTVATQTFRFQ